ncbi:MAG: efflux RND transporter periplasmic adaptor subunit [Cyanobacteriota bacterium]
MKKYKTSILIIVGIVVVIVIATIAIVGHYDFHGWQDVRYQKVKESFTVSGNVESLSKSYLKAPLSGKIESVRFDEGIEISENDILASYDKKPYEARVEELEAILHEARQNYLKLNSGYRDQEVEAAKAAFEKQKDLLKLKNLEHEKVLKDKSRNTTLFEKEMLTPKEYEDYIKNLEITEAAVEDQQNAVKVAHSEYNLLKDGFRIEDIRSAKSNIEKVQAMLKEAFDTFDKTDIRSPISGKIISKSVDTGDNVQAGDPLFTIYNKSNLEIKALIEEEDIRNIKLHDTVKIVLDAYPDKTLTGKITAVYDKVEESTRLLPVKIDIIENKHNIDILPGMTTSCTFTGHEINYLTVPKDALQRDGKKYFVETKQGKVYLEVGKEHGDRVLVKGNLTDKDMVYVK